MKKTDFNFITPYCAKCKKPAGDIHELIGGISNKKGNSDRDKCIKYHIQLPLCRDCHILFGSSGKKFFIIGCEILGLDNYETYRAIHENDVKTLSCISEKCKGFYKKSYGIIL